ncbi:MAG: PAS domain S-box protein [Bacteroidota bacterium]
MKPFLNVPPEYDTISDGLWDLDVKNKKICLSPSASKLLGHEHPHVCTREDVLNVYVHNDYKNLLNGEIEKLLKNRSDIIDTEIKLKPKSKECRWIHVKGVPVSRNPEGIPDRLLGSITDITSLKKAEKEIDRERKVLRTIIDNLPVTIYILDNQGRKILSNKADCGFIGALDESEVFGKNDLELYPGAVGERGHKDNMDVINSKTAVLNREEDFPDKNGNQKWLLTSKIPLLDQDNQITGLVGIGVDITEQKSLQKKISESETFYRTLINISPFGVVVADLEGKVTFVSKRAYQIFNVPEEEDHTGENILNWVAPESFISAKTNFKDVISGSRPPHTLEYKAIKNDGSEFWTELSSSLVFDFSGRPAGLMIVCRDITYRKKIEEDLISAKNKAEENDKLKTAFLHNISHEIRTPLNAIVGFSSLLDEQDFSKDEQRSYIEIIMKSSDHLLAIINDIIEISNIEAGIVTLIENEFNLNDLIKDLYNQFNLTAEKKNIQLKCFYGIWDETVTIRSDKTKLVQIISNLLSNSLKFTDTGIINFGYKLEEENILFYISDTGKGIPQNKFRKIFDRFYQVEHSENRLYEGTGLGLSISRAYVGLLGGHIWLNSRVGEGTTFYFTIPLNKLKISSVNQETLYTKDQTIPVKEKTILVAEDDDNSYRLLCEILQPLGHIIIRSNDGIEAIEIVRSHPEIDLILMDIKMPNMDGLDATRQIKVILPDLPVIALTAYNSESDKVTVSNIGFSDFITKPFSPEVLIDSINRVIK